MIQHITFFLFGLIIYIYGWLEGRRSGKKANWQPSPQGLNVHNGIVYLAPTSNYNRWIAYYEGIPNGVHGHGDTWREAGFDLTRHFTINSTEL